jgi:hypothetical protein
MSLPYESATSGQKAINEIQKILRNFGCSKFATGEDFKTGELFIQFEHRGRPISLKASAKGYAEAYLRKNPWNSRRRVSQHEYEAKAMATGSIAVYSILRDWVKGQITAVETGILSFESAFLSHIMLPNGRRVIEELENNKMLPPPT